MADLNVQNTTYTDLTNEVEPFEVDPRASDGVHYNETYWDNPHFQKWFGYYKKIPELKKPTDALALWTVGKGFTASPRTQVILDNITGWGEDSISSILFNLFVIKKINGDAYAEIVRDKNERIINLKPLDPSTMRTVANSQGIITRYEQRNKVTNTTTKKFRPEQIFHIVNDRVADEIHGTSVVEVCEDIILARNEAITDYRKLLHRNIVPVRIIEIDSDDTTQINKMRVQYEDAIKKGEVLIVPKGNVEIKEAGQNVQDPTSWIRYLENFFYVALGVPRVMLGGSPEGITEASAKMSHFSFQEVWQAEQRQMEDDIRLQLGLRVSFEGNASIQGQVKSSEAANTGQIGLQPNDTMMGLNRQ